MTYRRIACWLSKGTREQNIPAPVHPHPHARKHAHALTNVRARSHTHIHTKIYKTCCFSTKKMVLPTQFTVKLKVLCLSLEFSDKSLAFRTFAIYFITTAVCFVSRQEQEM